MESGRREVSFVPVAGVKMCQEEGGMPFPSDKLLKTGRALWRVTSGYGT